MIKLSRLLKRYKGYIACSIGSILITLLLVILGGKARLDIATFDIRLPKSKTILALVINDISFNKCGAELSEYLKKYENSNIKNTKYSKEVGLFLLANNQSFNTVVNTSQYNELRDFSAHQICIGTIKQGLKSCNLEEIEKFEDALRNLDQEKLLQKSSYVNSNITRYSLSEWGKVVFSTLYSAEDRANLDLKYKDDKVFDLLRRNSGYETAISK